jgi:hypothetical protein
MRLVDSVDDSYILRRASYGMLQDEVSKYSTNMLKINLVNASKPKVYNVKNAIDASLLGVTNAMGRTTKPRGRINQTTSSGAGFNVGIAVNKGDFGSGNGFGAGVGANGGAGFGGNGSGNGNGNGNGNGLGGQVKIETIKVPYPVLIDRANIIGKSDNSIFNNNVFYGNAKMQIKIYPYDNIIKFIIASGDPLKPDYLDMTGLGEIKMTFRNDNTTEEFTLLAESTDINLKLGQVVFKVPQSKVISIKKIYESGVNLFYIIASSQENVSVVYTGLFQIFDNLANVSTLNKDSVTEGNKPSINQDPNLPKETAVVTRKLITGETVPTKKGG